MNTPKKIKNYLKNMKYQLSLVYSKEDVRAIMDIIQEHVNIFLEQNPSASEENIKQCICEIGDFVQAGIENIDFHTLMQKIEVTNRAKKEKYIFRNKIYHSSLPIIFMSFLVLILNHLMKIIFILFYIITF